MPKIWQLINPFLEIIFANLGILSAKNLAVIDNPPLPKPSPEANSILA